MNRIIACAFKNRDVQNMVKTVVRERPSEEQEAKKAVVKSWIRISGNPSDRKRSMAKRSCQACALCMGGLCL